MHIWTYHSQVWIVVCGNAFRKEAEIRVTNFPIKISNVDCGSGVIFFTQKESRLLER